MNKPKPAFAARILLPAAPALPRSSRAACSPLAAEPAAPTAPSTATPMEAMEAALDAAYKSLSPDARTAPDLYAAAKARLGEARTLWKDDPESEETKASLMACSLLTEAAVTQIRAQTPAGGAGPALPNSAPRS